MDCGSTMRGSLGAPTIRLGPAGPRPVLAIAACVLALVACAGPVDTRIRVVVDADPSVRARSRDLHVTVDSVRDQETSRYEETRPTSEIGWPAEVSLVPRVGTGAAQVHLAVAALGPTGAVVSRGELSTSFELGATREIRLFLTSSCGDHACSAQDAGPPMRDAGSSAPLRDAGSSAPLRDAGPSAPPRDAGPSAPLRDAGSSAPPRDAGPSAPPRDAGRECTDGTSRACAGEERGLCTAGTQSCSGGRWGACMGRVDAAGESCNRADDDCDGATDERVTRPCGREGRCSQACRDGEWGRCERHGDRCGGHDDERDDD